MRRVLVALALALGVTLAAALPAEASGLRMPRYVYVVIAQGRCDWLRPHLARAGLPVALFVAIAARESGCARGGVRVANRTDLSTSRFGLNFRGSMPRYWKRLCGVSNWRTPGASLSADLRCTAAAYHKMGVRPWR